IYLFERSAHISGDLFSIERFDSVFRERMFEGAINKIEGIEERAVEIEEDGADILEHIDLIFYGSKQFNLYYTFSSVRLKPFEQQAIRETVHQFLPEARVYLYGSRVDDAKRGGDIDIMIVDDQPISFQTVGKIRWRLWEIIGEQKIDILAEQEGK